ncbi:MAG: FAD-binding oxidoreductase [Candidatus Thorarchaeota archaeon]
MDKKIVDEIAAIVGEEYVSTRQDVLLTYSQSASTGFDGAMPDLVVKPGSTEEVAAIVKLANRYKIPVTPRSGGTSLQGEVIPKYGGIVIELLRLKEITLFEDLRSVRVGAGVTFGQLDKFLNHHGLWVPVYPESSLSCTVAGNVVVNGAGPGSSKYGSIAEMVLGLTVVLPTGEIIKTGSEGNPNAPGPYLRYSFGPDITGLFIGSLGMFGIITTISVKTYKRMKFFDYNTYGFETAEQAERFIHELKQNDVNTLFMSLYEGQILDFFMEMLGEEYGIPKYDWPPYTVSLIIGHVRKDVMQSDAAMAREICENLDGFVINIPEFPRGEWEDRLRTFARASYAHGWHWRILYHHHTPMHWHYVIEKIWEGLDKFGILGQTAGFATGHASFNFYPHLYFDPADKEDEEKVRAMHTWLAEQVFKVGAVPFKIAPYWFKDVPEMTDYLNLVKRMKKEMDPNNILNPHILGGEE